MANMSYCRHSNTASDLHDVYENWHDFDEEEEQMNNPSEVMARKYIIELCISILEMEDYTVTKEDE
jgi:hypothetical protein